ncbi:hypothetical protein CH373_12440 [Leptospira perolatii]|uniref:Lipoprotein n=1 Tax=Leptospira perolatii TaxID=2023191 RepID=A0A2M9ZLL9_9LEPT|nr:hypothetical protein CH360_06530 [Leptospira perolatii]PJZ72937.1 hypothetical protein CH373_12440 [Leptospira perolatii]
MVFQLVACSFFGGKKGREDVDLKSAKWLVAEQVATVLNNEGVPVKPGQTNSPIVQIHNLFALPPGTSVSTASLSGTIDPTGTTIVNDFDGDGILNTDETTTNVWVADYPQVETIVAPPVTLKIKILQSTQTQNDEIVSEINSDDFESTKNQGSEKIHQKEMNERTVQFQDSFSQNTSVSNSVSTSANYGANYLGSGASYGMSASASWNASNGVSATTTKWDTKPFKNNIDSDAWNLKSGSSANKARKYRSDKSIKIDGTSKVDANAGYVRAALYIRNNSVNMPVKLSNIMCTLMFENGSGELIPMQSFRLRNDDYSLFTVEVYGGSEFGPYVVELNGLNTAEIERAIAAGYNPKIFIVDYEMTHVANSNYRSALLNYSGDNLKIVEENAKGRTALLKVYGPNIRELYRVAAFNAPGTGDPCTTRTASTLAPGVSLKEALNRIACSGVEIQYEDYVIDLAEQAPSLGQSRFHVKGIKSFGGVQTTLPCNYQTFTGSDGVSRTACVQKPVSQWTESESQNFGLWAIYYKGKYYSHTEFWKDGSTVRLFDPPSISKAPMVKGVDSTIWAGDRFDIVYLSAKDFIQQAQAFGTNPLETDEGTKVNTVWDNTSLGEHPYYPNTNSVFLGEGGFGEKINLNIKLNKTQYLTPNFGTPVDGGTYLSYSDFQYNLRTRTDFYTIDQAADFEISMGIGGARTDWFHVVKDINDADPYKPQNCGRTLDFVNQEFNLCVKLPTQSAVVDPSITLVKLYIRPSLNTAYRKTIWPLHYSQVRKMRGELGNPTIVGDLSIRVAKSSGLAEVGDTIQLLGDYRQYTISSIGAPDVDGSYLVTLASPIQQASKKTTEVYITGSLSAPDVRLSVDNGFYTDWNSQVSSAFQPTNFSQAQYLPFLTSSSVSCSTTNAFHPQSCLGVYPDVNATNWMGVYNQGVALWNSWADGGSFQSFLSAGLFKLAAGTGKSYRLEAAASDFVVSEVNGVTTMSNPKVASDGDTAFVVWKQNSSLIGKFYQISTGNQLTAATVLNTATATGKFVVKAKNGRVVFIWESNSDIYIALKDMTTYANIGSESKVVTRGTFASGTAPYIDLGVGNDRAIVAWNTSIASGSGVQHTGSARVYRTDTGASLNAAFNFYVPSAEGLPSALEVSADATGDYGILSVLLRNLPAGTTYMRTFRYDLPNLTLGTLRSVGSNTNALYYDLRSIASNNYGALTARRDDGYSFISIMNLTDNTSPLAIPSGFASGSTSISAAHLSASGDTVLITWINNNRTYIKVVSLSLGNYLYANTLSPDSGATVTNRQYAMSFISGNNILTKWMHFENGLRTIRGRTSTLSPFALKGASEFFISTTNQGEQQYGGVAVSGQKAFIAWWSNDIAQQRIRGFSLDIQNPGALQYGLNNFFVAPLIERDYTIKAKISY